MGHKRQEGPPGWFAVRVTPLLAALLLAAALAGCSSKDGGAPAPSAGPDFTDLGLEATSTTGVIRGIVVDSAIRPLANATVVLTPGDQTAHSTAAGTFGFDGLEAGSYFLKVRKAGYSETQTSAQVDAGVQDPPLVHVQMAALPGTAPYYETYVFHAFITCGAAIVATSVGCDTSPDVGKALGDQVYFQFNFTTLPMLTQGELVWEQTQPAGGEMIWEIADPDAPPPQPHVGYRETGTSPALAYINRTDLEANQDWIMKDGVLYRIFGGPHPLCTDPLGATFGCGITFQQRLDAYIHNFYNFLPPDGWRFTRDGNPVVPQ